MGLERLKQLKTAQLAVAAEPEQVKDKDLLKKLREFNASETGKEIRYAEVNRIIALPVDMGMGPEEAEEFSRMHVLASAFNAGFRLFLAQANAVFAYQMYGGAICPIGVGWGKTLINLMVANYAYNSEKLYQILLMLPPEVLGQLVERDIPWARARVPLSVPIHVLGGRSRNYREAMAKSGKRGLYIMPYSLLSQADGEDNICSINPQLLILDEAHKVARFGTARFGRIERFLNDRQPRLVSLSGTITSKSVMDYYPFLRQSLRSNCPLPLTSSLARSWGEIIDANAEDWEDQDGSLEQEGTVGSIEPLIGWARKNFPQENIPYSRDGIRLAYKLRLIYCPGVVSSGDAEIPCSLIFHNTPIEKHESHLKWKELDALIRQVEEQWLTPNKDEIDHAFHQWKWLYELAAGFYNELTWPEVAVFAERKNISGAEAEEILEKAKEHHAAGQEYHKELRRWLQAHAKPRLDTPRLVGKDMSLNGPANVGNSLYDTWREWKGKNFEGRPERDKRAVHVCDYKIKAAANWAASLGKDEGAILWVQNVEVGEWLFEELEKRGMDCLHARAGNRDIEEASNKHKKVVASIPSHGTGKNLQHFQHQCMVQWPRAARAAEQLLGRLHRNGQEADEIVAITFNTVEFDHLNFAACLNDALYAHLTTGLRQKMIYGSYTKTPKIFPPAVLRARGAEGIQMLTEDQQRFMQERFGK